MTWISTQQQLPDVDLTVLGLLPDREVWPMWLETDDGPLWRFLDGDPVREPVTHWMPLPEPPTEVA